METVCLTCGDKGITDALICCEACHVHAVHRYCLDVLPKTFDEFVAWFCLDCEPRSCSSDNLEIDQTGKLGSILKKNEKRKKIELEEQNSKKRKGHPQISTKSEDPGTLNKLERTGIFSKSERRKPESGSHETVKVFSGSINKTNQGFGRQKCLSTNCSPKNSGSMRNEASVAATSNPVNGPEHDAIVQEPSTINSDELGEEADLVRTRTSSELGYENRQSGARKSYKEVHSGTTKKRKEDPRNLMKLGYPEISNKLERPGILSKSEYRKPENGSPELVKVCSGSINKTNQRFGGQKCSSSNSSPKNSGSMRNEAYVAATRNPANGPEHDAIVHEPSTLNSGELGEEADLVRTGTSLDLAYEYRQLGAGKSYKEVDSGTTKKTIVDAHDRFGVPKCNIYIVAQPIIEPVWRGCLSLDDESFGVVEGLVAHLSSLACPIVCEAARSLPVCLSSKLLPRLDIWPKHFLKGGPNDESIGLYFFPAHQRDEKNFDALVDEMMEKDLAMRAILGDAVLLFFTSFVLPMRFWRFQSKFYLWGVFKGSQASSGRAVVLEQDKGNPKTNNLTWDSQSSGSPSSSEHSSVCQSVA